MWIKIIRNTFARGRLLEAGKRYKADKKTAQLLISMGKAVDWESTRKPWTRVKEGDE